jgi:hypothetical protein
MQALCELRDGWIAPLLTCYRELHVVHRAVWCVRVCEL